MSQITNLKMHPYEAKTLIEIGTLIFFKKFALFQAKEGAHLGLDEIQKIEIILSEYYEDKPYGYLCNKEISYSVNPIGYKVFNRIEQLKCIAILKKFSRGHDIEVERHFVKKPFKTFSSFEDASDWINAFI